MNLVDAFRRVGSGASSEAGRIAASLCADPLRGLSCVAAFLRSGAIEQAAPAARLGMLLQLSDALRPALDSLVRGLRNQRLPYAAHELEACHRAMLALEALREAFERQHADPVDPPGGHRPGAAAAPPRSAFACALDAQSLRLVTAWRLRIAVDHEHWEELCRLVLPLWQGAALDVARPASSGAGPTAAPGGHDDAIRPPGTPRAAFTLPLLLRLLEPLGLSFAERRIAASLAGEVAGTVGIRIDADGLPHLSPVGPALVLSVRHTVRLDTCQALSVLDRLHAALEARVPPARLGLRTALAAPAITALLGRIRPVWAPLHVPAPLARAPFARALLHVGLPDAALHGPGDGACDTDRPGSLGTALHARAEPVSWRGLDACRSVFSRCARTPRLGLGQLVAVLPCQANAAAGREPFVRAGAGPARLRLGRIATLVHTGALGSRHPFGSDVGVAFWPGSPLPVRVRLEDGAGFEDGWWLPAVPAQAPASLVLRRDRFEHPIEARVHGAAGAQVLRLLGLLERGLDFDRVAIDPGATGPDAASPGAGPLDDSR